MRNYLIIICGLMFANNVAAKTDLQNLSEKDFKVVVVKDIDCNALYNSTLKYMLTRYPKEVAEFTAAATSNACFDEKEKLAGTNPGCK